LSSLSNFGNLRNSLLADSQKQVNRMSFIIGSCRIVLYLAAVSSLKEKRQVLKSLKDRLRNKFNLAVSEIDDCALWQKATLGIVCVTNERRSGQVYLDRVINFFQAEPGIKIVDYEIKVH